MSFIIDTSLLTRTVTITRPSTTPDARGLMGAPSTVSAVAKVRIYNNNDFITSGDTQEQGIVAKSSHKGMCLPTEDIATGDTITDNATAEEFRVNLVDKMPAGYTGHHYELFLSSAKYG